MRAQQSRHGPGLRCLAIKAFKDSSGCTPRCSPAAALQLPYSLCQGCTPGESLGMSLPASSSACSVSRLQVSLQVQHATVAQANRHTSEDAFRLEATKEASRQSFAPQKAHNKTKQCVQK